MKDERNLFSPKNRPHRERNIEITRAYYVTGLTCREIGQVHGLSRARVNQIIHTAVRQHSYSEKLPHLRLPPDIAEKLAKPLPRWMIGQDLLTKVWTPQEVEEETLAGYWRRWPMDSQRLTRPWTLADLMHDLGMTPAATPVPSSDTPASAQSPQNAPVPRSK